MLYDIRYDGKKILCSIFAESKLDALTAFLDSQGTLTGEELSKIEAEENKSWNNS